MPSALMSAPFEQVAMPAVDLRRLVGGLIAAEGIASSADLAVAQRAAGANMSVDVAAGQAYIADDHTGGGGFYKAQLAATQNVGIGAADPTNPRVDRIVWRIRDAYLGDAANDSDIAVVAGTPTAGATLSNLNGAAGVPGSSLLLANVLVGAAVSSITTANIGNVAAALRTAGSVRVVTGNVTGAGGITAGTGFTVSRTATGRYTVTFTTAFTVAPLVLVTAISGFTVAWVGSVTTTTCDVLTNSVSPAAAVDNGFYLFAREMA